MLNCRGPWRNVGFTNFTPSRNEIPMFTGPYFSLPSGANQKPRNKSSNGSDIRGKDDIEYKRLSDFVSHVAQKVDIWRKYKEEDLIKHASDVEKIVQNICANLGKNNPAFKVVEIIKRGSFYERCKILQPNEFDFLPVLATTENDVEIVHDDFMDRGKERMNVKIKPGAANQLLTKSQLECTSKPRLYTYNEFMRTIREEITGKYYAQDQKYDTESERSTVQKIAGPECETDVCVSSHPHGPSTILKIAGPLCETKVDLCFCLERKIKGKPGRYVIVPNIVDRWRESTVEPSNCDKYTLNLQHQELFLCLKYIAHCVKRIASDVLVLLMMTATRCRPIRYHRTT
ncbi:unnamed protein product [Owenia fusiformis]|uniref:Uncharacterized protein n=1 Tax=Owenia fusiformis TaxID=6347 RepID=A0A8J1UCV0_OWEFU|nr:unnamed protein product [Owenia fusiformis]